MCRAAVIYFPPRRRGIRIADISESIFGTPPLLYSRHVSGYSITCDVTDSVQRSLFYTGTYEPAATRLIRQHLHKHDVFVDVGANAGHFTFLAASIVGPSGHVHAIEASPSTAERLVADVVSNKLEDTVTIHRTAAFDESGVAVIVEDVGSPHRIGGRHLDRSADDGETRFDCSARPRQLEQVADLATIPVLHALELTSCAERVLSRRHAPPGCRTSRPRHR